MPVLSSPSADASSFETASTHRSSAKPPPGTMPSLTAALVALMASSSASFLAFISDSAGAPTRMTATPPESLAKTLLQLLAIVVGFRLLDLGFDLLHPRFDVGLLPGAVDDRRVVLVDRDAVGAAQHGEGHVLELDAEILADDRAAGQDRNVLEHRLAAVAEAWRLHRGRLEPASQLVDDECGQSLALDLLGDDQQRPAGLNHALQQRQHRLQTGELLFVDQDVGFRQFDGHLLGVGHEIRRHEPAIELHALHDLECRLGRLGFLDGDDAFTADLLHGIGHEFADDRVVVSRDGRDLRLLLPLLDRPRQSLERLDGGLGGTIQTALDVDGTGAGHDVSHAVGKDGVRQDRRRARSVTDVLAGLLGGLAQHLGAEVFLRILEVELLGDRHAVVADERHAPFLLDQNGLGFWTQRDADGICELSRPTQDLLARGRPEENLLVCHVADLISRLVRSEQCSRRGLGKRV